MKNIRSSLKKAVSPVAVISFVFVLLLLVVFLVAVTQNVRISKRVGLELESIANLKANEINRWQNEHITNFQVRAKNNPLVKRLISIIQNRSKKNSDIIKWMQENVERKDYSQVLLYDIKKKVRLSYPPAAKGTTNLSVLKTNLKTILLTDLYLNNSDKSPHMDLIMPLIERNRNGEQLKGFLVFQVDAEKYLFPLIQTWPTPSETSETLLFRKEGEDILYLNELRHRKNSALKLKISIKENQNIAAVQGLTGNSGIIYSVDYRGHDVIACVRKIPNSAWYVVAKTDSEEINWEQRSLWSNYFLWLAALIIIGGISIFFARRDEKNAHFKKLYALEKEKRKLAIRYDNLTRYANDIILVCDSNLKITDANEQAIKTYGYSSTEIIQYKISDFEIDDKSILTSPVEIEELLNSPRVYESAHRKKDGSVFPVDISAQANHFENEMQYFFIIRDITERKRAAEAINRQNSIFNALMDNLPIGVFMVEVPTGKPLIANIVARNLLGRGILPDVNKKNLSEVYQAYKAGTGKHYPTEEMPIVRGMRGEKSYIDDMEVERPDGTRILLEIYGTPITDNGVTWASIVVFSDITERKKIEGKIRAFSNILEDSLNEVYLFDAKTLKFLFVNAAVLNNLKYTLEEILQLTPVDIKPEYTYDSFLKAINPLLTGEKEVLIFETVHQRKDGTVYNVEIHLQPTEFEEKKALAAIVLDITERKRAEIKLRESEERFRNLYEDATIGLYRTTPDGKILMANKTLIKMLGYSTFEELSAINLEKGEFQSSSQRKEFLDRIEKEGEVFKLETTWTIRNGDAIIVQENAKAIRGSDGAILYFDGIVEDITERRKTNEALKQSEDRFRTLFENMTEGVALHELIYDGNGNPVDYKILSINPSFVKHTGISEEQIVGQLASVAYKTDALPYLEEYSNVVKSGIPYAFETYFAPMGKHFRISVFSPKQGQFATVFEDITTVKKREEDLKQRNDEMARFTYTVSHDLKSPLVTIKTFLGYLEEDIKKNDEANRKKDTEFIQNAAQKMSSLLDELLNLSRIGRKTIQFTEISFNTIVQEALQLVAGQLLNRNVNVEVTGESVLLYCERQRIVEVFQNLIDNSIKFMGDQPNPLIQINVNKLNGEFVFSVKDNGIGIDPKYHSRIFNIFEKLNPQTAGTGIGLSAVSRIIEYHRGKIWVESEGIGKGTAVKFAIDKTKPGNIKDGISNN